ncbi:iron ABC transporter permease [Yoonia sp. GPGPB17]|uniref:FecCD family ABC transporter permease n=1 Tax=Yoonia sp. GPGPB17 TaxID=3026147 RepID=UPI0030BB8D3A
MLARLLTALLAGALLLTMLLSLGWGAASDTDVVGALIGADDVSLRDRTIVWDIRLPRTLIGALVGAALAVSGAVLQGLFRNPLADPGLVGVSAGASFGAVIAIVLGGSAPFWLQASLGSFMVPFAAFLGGWITTILLYSVATRNGRTSVATMLLAGLALAALASALTGVLVYYATDDELRDLTFWGLGSVAGANWQKFWSAAPLIIVCLLAAPFLARSLNALALGEAAAGHLGIRVQAMKRIAILTVACSVGASVAVTGGIGFVGIVVPHLLRLVQGPDHRGLLINSALLGGVMLLLADAIARTVIAPAEMPIGIITAIIGGPFFLWILMRNRALVDL